MIEENTEDGDILLSLVPKKRLKKLLKALLDENEFLSVAGIRSISRIHEKGYNVYINGEQFGLTYQPAEGESSLFGGNSNWRGPVWMPMNYLLVLALEEYGKYYGDQTIAEFPTGSGKYFRLDEVSKQIAQRLISIFLPRSNGARPVHSDHNIYARDKHFMDLILFYEYFHGENGRGVGASHQTGWTGVIAELISRVNNYPGFDEVKYLPDEGNILLHN